MVPIFYVLAGMLALGWIANLLVRPVDSKWHMSEAEVAAVQTGRKPVAAAAACPLPVPSARAGSMRRAASFWLLMQASRSRMGSLEYGSEGVGAVPLELRTRLQVVRGHHDEPRRRVRPLKPKWRNRTPAERELAEAIDAD